MQFDETKALEIIERLNLSASTLKVWRNRKAIPDRYADLEAAADVVRVKKTNPEAVRLREILSMKELNKAGFTPGKRAGDIVKGDAAITKDEILTYKSDFVQLRNKIRAAIDRGSYSTILADRRLHPTIIVSKAIYDKIHRESWLTEKEKEEIKFELIRIHNLLRM